MAKSLTVLVLILIVLAVAAFGNNPPGRGQSKPTQESLDKLWKEINSSYKAAEFGKCERLLHEYIDRSRIAGSGLGVARGLDGLALVSMAEGKYESAIGFFNRAEGAFEKAGDEQAASFCYYNLAKVYRKIGKPGKALEFDKLALGGFQKRKSDIDIADANNDIGLDFFQMGNGAEAVRAHLASLSVAKRIFNNEYVARSLQNLGNAYIYLGQFEDAKRVEAEALEISRKSKNQKNTADCLNNLGNACHALGEYGMALQCRLEAIDLYKAGDWQADAADCQANLAATYFALLDYDKAIGSYSQALSSAKKNGDEHFVAILAIDIGAVLESSGQYERAHAYFRESLNAARKVADPVLAASALLELSQVELHIEDYPVALQSTVESAAAYKAGGDLKGEARALMFRSQVYSAKGRPDQAIASDKEVLAILRKSLPDATVFVEVYKSLAATEQARGNLEAAAKYLDSAEAHLGSRAQVSKASLEISRGKLYIAADPGKAELALDRAFKTLSKSHETKSETYCGYLRAVGDLRAAKGQTAKALDAYREADGLRRDLEVRRAAVRASAEMQAERGRPTARGGDERSILLRDVSGSRSSGAVGPAAGSTDDLYSHSKRYALLIGTSKYKSFRELSNPVRDANALAGVLRTRFGFESQVLENPTLADIAAWFDSFSKRDYGQGDQLFVFIAGHGTYWPQAKEGELVLTDSRADGDPLYKTYLSFLDLAQLLDNLKVKHICLALDVCYGGMFDPRVADSSGSFRAAENDSELTPMEFVNQKLHAKTRKLLTSGRDVPVPDGPPGEHSPFAARLLETLQAEPKRGYVSFLDLFKAVQLLRSQPQECDFGHHDVETDFPLVLKRK